MSKVKVDFDTAKAQVDYDDEQTTPEKLCRRLEVTSDGRYTAKPEK